MKRYVRKLAIVMGVVSVLMAGTVTGLVAYLQSSHAGRMIRNAVNQRIAGTITWESQRISLFRGRVELNALRIQDDRNRDVAGFEHFAVDISWRSLLRGVVDIEDLLIESLWANLVTDETGRLNLEVVFSPSAPPELPEQPETKPPGFPLNVVLRSARIVQASLGLKLAEDILETRLDQVDLTVSGVDLKSRSGKFTLTVTDARIAGPGVDVPSARLEAEAALHGGVISPLICRLETGTSQVSIGGGIQDAFGTPAADLNLKTDLSLADIRGILGLKPELTGLVSAHAGVRGEAGNPDVVVEMDYGGGIIAGYPVKSLRLETSLREAVADLKLLQVEAASGTLTAEGSVNLKKAFEKGFLGAHRNPDAIGYRLAVRCRDISLEQLMLPSSGLTGTVDADMSAAGTGISSSARKLEATVRIGAKQVAVAHGNLPVDMNLNGVLQLDGTRAGIRQLAVQTEGVHLAARGDYDLSSERIDADLDLDAADLSPLLSAFNVQSPHGRMKLHARVSGDVKRPVADMDLDGKQLGIQDFTVGDVGMAASLDSSGLLKVSRLEVENQGAMIQANGSVKLFRPSFTLDPELPLQVSATLQQLDLEKFVPGEIASGIMDARVSAEGRIRELKAKASVTGKDLFVRPVRLGNLRAGLRVSDGRMFLDRLDIRNRRSMLNVSGSAQILDPSGMRPAEDPEFQCELSSSGIYLQDFSDRIKGKTVLSAQLEGTLRHPRGKMVLQGTDLDLAVQQIKELELESEFDGEKIHFRPLRIRVTPEEQIETTGWVAVDKTFQLRLSSKGIRLGHIDWVHRQGIADGTIAFGFDADGSLEQPAVEGRLTTGDLHIMGRRVKDIDAGILVKDGLARIQARMDVDLEAAFHLETKDFSAKVRCEDTDLTPYVRMLDLIPDAGGRLNATVDVRGNAGNLDQLEGFVDITGLELLSKQQTWVKTEKFQLRLRNKALQIQPSRMMLGRDGRIDISGEADLAGALDIRIKGDIPIRTAALMDSSFSDASGSVRLSGTISGTASEPGIDLNMDLFDLTMTLPVTLQKLEGVSGAIRATSKAVVFDRIQGRLDTGRFSLSGRLDLEAFRPKDLSVELKAESLPVRIPDTLDMTINATLKMAGTPDKSLLQGQVVLLDGTYYRDVNLSLIQMIETKKREAPPAPTPLTQPFIRNMGLDVSFQRRNPFVVDNNLAFLEILPDLRIGGTLNQPVVTGRAEVQSGTVRYQKKTFTVTRGVVDFINPYRIEPLLDISSQVQVRDWSITLDISGTPDQLKFKLSSVPAEEDPDIISLLVFGKTTSELIESEGGTMQSPSRMLAELLASTFAEDIKKTTGLDIFEVETEGNGNGEELIKVTVGKELSERMTIKYETESKSGEMLQKAIAEYKLLEHILLSGFQDSEGFFGGEFMFRLEFR